jgi:hypothetical protein
MPKFKMTLYSYSKMSRTAIAATFAALALAQDSEHTARLERKINDAFTSLAKKDTVIHTSARETGRPVFHEDENRKHCIYLIIARLRG